jgi:hypothetical protein
MLFVSAIAVTPLVNFIGVKPTIMSAAVAGPATRLRPTRSYTYLGIVADGNPGGGREVAEGELPIPISARG